MLHLTVVAGIFAAFLLWMPDLWALHLWVPTGALIFGAFLGAGLVLGAGTLLLVLVAGVLLVAAVEALGYRLPDPEPPFRDSVLGL